MRTLADRAEVRQSVPLALPPDQAPQESLAGHTREHSLRRTPRLRDQVTGQACQGHHRDVGHGPQPLHEQIADMRAHGRRPHDDGERRQRPAPAKLLYALAERVFELREAAAHEQPSMLVDPVGHAGRQRITRP